MSKKEVNDHQSTVRLEKLSPPYYISNILQWGQLEALYLSICHKPKSEPNSRKSFHTIQEAFDSTWISPGIISHYNVEVSQVRNHCIIYSINHENISIPKTTSIGAYQKYR